MSAQDNVKTEKSHRAAAMPPRELAGASCRQSPPLPRGQRGAGFATEAVTPVYFRLLRKRGVRKPGQVMPQYNTCSRMVKLGCATETPGTRLPLGDFLCRTMVYGYSLSPCLLWVPLHLQEIWTKPPPKKALLARQQAARVSDLAVAHAPRKAEQPEPELCASRKLGRSRKASQKQGVAQGTKFAELSKAYCKDVASQLW